ncbi:MAG: protein kinase [Pseudomonadales bacterium]
MTDRSAKPTWQTIEKLLDELLDMPLDERTARLQVLDAQAPDYAIAARKALAATTQGSQLDAGLDGLAGSLLRDLISKEAGSAIGTELSVYRLDAVIGRGGMGVVYRASRVDGQFDQQVAIKKIPFGLAGERGIARFQEERTILASVQHPFIGQLLDGGLDDEGLPYLVMELVDGGQSIDSFTSSSGLNQKQALSLFKEVCDAVAFLHRNLITHGDIKPGNVLVRPDGHPKLIDFGISKLATAAEGVKPVRLHGATPGYAPPEQTRGATITTQSDIYALGATLESVLMNCAEYGATLAPDLQAIISQCKQADPDDRYATVEAVAADIDAFLEFRPVAARASSLAYRVTRFVRRHWLPVTAVGAVVASLVGGMSIANYQAGLARQDARRATAVSGFLISMFEQSADAYSTDGDPTLYDLVEAADARLDTELRDAPAVKADMQVIFGQAYDGLLNDTGKAKAHFMDVLAYAREFEPDNTPRILSMLGWIANMQWKEGDYEGADRIINEAIEIDLRDGQPDMTGWMTKAEIANQIGPPEAELDALSKAEQVYARRYGVRSNEMATVLAARALHVAKHGGGPAASIALLRQAIAMREGNGGGNWVSTDRMRSNLALEHYVLGSYDRALKVYEEVIANTEQRLGSDHSELVSMLNNVGALYNDAGDTITGRRTLERALDIARAQMEPGNFIRMALELNYARTLIWSGEPGRALSLLEPLEQRANEAVGQGHALTGVVQRDRAWALLDLGRLAEARSALDIARPKLKWFARRAVASKIDAELALAEGDLERARSHAIQSLADYIAADVSREWMFAEARLLLHKIHAAAGDQVDMAQSRSDGLLLQRNLSPRHRALRLVN